MNVWALNKTVSIKFFVYELLRQFGDKAIKINASVSHDAAIEVIAIDSPGLRAYVYSFAQSAGDYGVDLFYPVPAYNLVGANEALSLDKLLAVLEVHFDLCRATVKAL